MILIRISVSDMSSFEKLVKLDRGEYVDCKNLRLERFLPNHMPFVLESVITELELFTGLCGDTDPPHFPSDDQIKHYRLICQKIFEWSQFDRMMYLYEDQYYDFKHGHPPYSPLLPDIANLYRPLMIPTNEIFATYDL